MIPCRFTRPLDGYRMVAICLNCVHLRELTPDETMRKLVDFGLAPELRYQWNPDSQEIDVYAVVCEEPIEEWSLGDDRHDALWAIFGNESLLYIMSGTSAKGDGEDCYGWVARRSLENVPSPPPKLNNYFNLSHSQTESVAEKELKA